MSDVALQSLRSQIALVTQETVLFDDTVAGNIAYGVPNASRAAIESSPPPFQATLGELEKDLEALKASHE